MPSYHPLILNRAGSKTFASLFLLICLLAVGGWSCHGKKSSHYVNREQGFAITFPEGWEVREKEMGFAAIAFSPLTAANDDFRENVAVAVSAMPKTLDADGILDANLPAMMKMITDFKPETRGYLQIGEVKAAFLRYTMRQGKFRLTATIFALPGKTHAYLIYCTGETDYVEQFKDDFAKAVTSFKVKG